MRSPSPRRRYSPSRKPFRRGNSPGGYKKRRSRSRSRGRRPPRRSTSPRYRRHSSPGRRSRSPRRRSPRRSRSPPRRSPVHHKDRFEPKALQMDRVPSRDGPPRRMSPILQPKDRQPVSSGGGGMRGFGMSPEKSAHARLSDPQDSKPRQSSLRGDFDPYHDTGGHGDKDYRTIPPSLQASSQRTKERFDQTTLSINERFSILTESDTPFLPAENITIGIERNIPGNEPAVMRKEISPNEVVIVRQKDEGSRMLSARVEFLGPKEEYVEKRTIRVAEENKPRSSHSSVGDSSKRQFLTDRWTVKQREESPVAMYKKQGMTREELDDFLLDAPTPSSRHSHGDRDDRMMSSRGSRPSQASGSHVDRDERIVLNRRDKPEDKYKFTVSINSPGFDEDYRDVKEKSKFERDPSDLRHNLSKKRGSDKDDNRIDARQKILKKRENELRKREDDLKKRSAQLERKEKQMRITDDPKSSSLPDFSNRPDKFQYNLPPDAIPTGGYYYEHDNRDQPFRGRGRGRGFFRGRGRGNFRDRGGPPNIRGGGPTRPFPSRGLTSHEWKHDKFEEMEDEKPTSTTKN